MTQYTLMNMKSRKIYALLLTAVLAGTGSSTVMAQGQTESTGPTVHGSVYGGGNLANVGGSVVVKIEAGTIDKDVYGGGALANTNTNNTTNPTTTVNLLGGKISGDAYGGGLGRLAKAGTAAVYTAVGNGTTLTTGKKYYTSDAGEGEFTSDGTEVADGTNYYELTTPAIAAIEAVEAKVYGDINVNLGSEGGTATAFDINYYSGDHSDVVNSGRVFGCNNLNGSPQGNVTVTVWKTVAGNTNRSGTANKNNANATYEVAAVYGGGNLANYTTAGKKTHVIINGCNDTSIKYVYGGGNAAAVPETDVDINAAYELGYVFGGGNGKDQYTLDGTTWINNPGANVSGNANTVLTGGVIHEAFGGSNEKGTISGSVSITTQAGASTCPLSIGKLYGAGKNADIEGDLIVIMGCMPGDENPTGEVYGGAENANVKGNVELTITSGSFGKVFGGNNQSGAIFGHIKLNIEETGCCPIKIDELYLGGYNAPYSIYGYYQDGNIEGTEKPKYVARQSASDHVDDIVSFTGNSHTVPPYAAPELNIISCTRIGKVFGGGLGTGAVIYGNPTVNINMINGTATGSLTTLGTIGDVYGGGNAANVIGNTAVNIGTETTIYVVVPDENITVGTTSVSSYYIYNQASYAAATGTAVAGTTYYQKTIVNGNDVYTPVAVENGASVSDYYTYNEANYSAATGTAVAGTTYYEKKDVQGAKISSNVYGGGQLADVGQYDVANDHVDVAGNTYVNIGAVAGDDPATTDVTEEYTSVSIQGTGYAGITIGGNVFGGGEGQAIEPTSSAAVDGAFKCAKAIVTGGTNIHIGNGTINGTVYGGGEVGRVEADAVVAIGIGAGGTTPASAPIILGDVFGAGKGKKTHGYSALMRGNPTVTIEGDAKVRGSVYGGGEIASVGRYNVKKGDNDPVGAPADVLPGMPYSLANSGSGYCTVIIRGNAEIGPATEMKMKTTSGIPDDTGHVIGGGKGVLPYDGYGVTDDDWIADPWRVSIDDKKDIFNSSNTTYTTNYEKEYFKYIETLALATETNVTIAGNAFVKGSVYGGSLNGHVQHDTHVTIAGGQIGAGEGMTEPYKATDWTGSTTPTGGWKECAHWDFDKDSGAPYDPMATTSGSYDYTNYGFVPEAARKTSSEGGLPEAKDGHTYYGNVFGGGSGVIPYAPGLWHRGAGSVGGNTYVNITGGHILTSVYGGNEHTDVGTYEKDASGQPTTTPAANDARGKCTVNMVGGTLGVPRTDADTRAHPVTCYLFGAGKGDQRIFFNTWTNVINTEVNISGDARIYGSVFGGGEDGHVIGDAETNIGNVTIKTGKNTSGVEITESATANGLIIGTTGTSYYDGNVFGGGRGFSGDAQTAGTVGGNVRLNINAGSVYGSVYGGGRLASVGTMFEFPTLTNGDPNPAYGNFKEDDTNGTYGHVTINISGGTIGKDYSTTTPLPDGIEHSGNVFGGSMGRLELLNGTRNPIWPKMAQVKTATVNISGTIDGTTIRRNVFGGGELGTVRDDAIVTISGGTIRRDVYGGGYGSEDMNYTIFSVFEPKADDPDAYVENTYAFSPMQFAGCVGKSTTVNVNGGYIRKSVYGGGEMASVGVYDCKVKEVDAVTSADVVVKEATTTSKAVVYSNMVKHADTTKEFALSWPYKFNYLSIYPGATHVNITGGRLGLKTDDTDTGFEDNGDVYGAGKGKAGDFNDYLFCANVGSTDVKIAYTSTPTEYSGTDDLIAGAVYGGGEDGHVIGDTKLTISGGLIYHSVYGGGSGKGLYNGSLLKIGATEESATASDYYNREVYSITAGKVFGNTEVNMSGGYVVRNIYGGGNMGSVGKGNYAGGTDDYSTDGYGEKVANLWSNTDFTGSGKCTVTITGGTIGYIDTTNPSNSMYPKNSTASLPYGNVFGGCRGEAAPDLDVTPSYLYSPEFFMGYVNETIVEIGKADGTGPTILGSVYGGGMDGHVRRDASVTIKGGEIGLPFTNDNKTNVVKTSAPENIQWLARGNVYGAGSGIGTYNANNIQYSGSYSGTHLTGTGNSTSAGSVTGSTKVDIQGGTIHRNVYGGGSLASVGAPKIPANRTDNPTKAQTLNEVKISGGQIGDDDYSYVDGNHVYGGHVFGGSRGDASLDATKFSTSMFTSITINPNATPANSPVIYGSVFGGGEVGIVKGSVDVTMNGGTVNDDVYGGGALANTNTENPKDNSGNVTSTSTYITTVNLYGGMIKGDAYGGGLGQVGTNPIAAMVYGDVAVNLGKTDRTTATAFKTSYFTGAHADVVKSGRVFGCNNLNGYPHGNVTVTVNKTVTGKDGSDNNLERTTATAKANNKTIKENNPENYESVTGYVTPTFEVAAVYGGGNLADYQATGKKASVIINSCDVSVNEVYGGGNAAEVPETDVLVNGAYEINHVYGGGNGKDDYTLDGGTNWTTNPGADINGNTYTLLKGGLIHEAYGGSNEKGTITGSVVINTGGDQPEYCDGCPLDVEKLVGAGKNADVNGDLIMVLGCKPATKTPLVYGGADNANVNGNVELTITSGTFGKVFGGNNLGGVIRGHIILNIEETGCNPIKIDELYLGGNQAAYSRYGYYQPTNPTTNEPLVDVNNKPVLLPRTAEMDAVASTDPTYIAPVGNPTEDANHPFPYAQPVLNVVSCTKIGKVFGGGLGAGAIMHADPTVNINMIPGEFANDTEKGVPAVMTAMNLSSDDNPNKLGIIGDVYGGGNAADVVGNPTVNIGTASTVQLHESYNATTHQYSMSGNRDVKGAYITGNVFGGGMGKDDTFTCEKAMVGIDGDGVANPVGGTTVNIYNGIVLGSVYGGGEVGRVEKNTAVTIGTGDGVDATTDTPTSAPEIRGSVFGGGKGLETHGYSALVRGNPTVVVQGNAKVRGNVYGGGQIASVARYNVAQTDDEGAPYGVKKDEPYALKNNTSGFCTVTIKGYAEIGPETIGSDVKTTTVGHVFGAGKGILPGGDYAFVPGTTKRMVAVRDGEGHITGSTWDYFTGGEADYITFVKTLALSSQTNVTIDGNAKVKGSVFGGSESGFVQFDANVNVTGGTIGTTGKGGADFGNVYGGGKGDVDYTGANHDYITAGIVKGNTKVVISQAEGKTTKILHNIYGGGAYGTVGEFDYDATTGMPTARKTYTIGTEVHNTTGGTAEIYITGGTIGTNGDENGMIFGSSRGDMGAPGSIHDKAAWVYDTHVAIGDTLASTTTTDSPLIKGSVYGGGENGHNFHNAYVRINGGTIGITEGEPIGSYTAGGASYPYRGNVYGGGCGTDKYEYDSDNNGSLDAEAFNPIAGIVQGNAFVNITGGIIVHNVYGAGAMGSVGKTVTTEGVSKTTGGVTTINISGGSRIGIDGTAGEGNVFGAARGDADATSNEFALVRKNTNVSVTGGTVKGNVYGGGELGCVGVYNISSDYRTFTWKNTDGTDNTADNSKNTGICNVTVDGASAVINGHVFGAGKGKDDTFWCEKGIAYSTNVSIQNGTVVKNIYGGGEEGRVETDTKVKIGDGEGTEGGASAPTITGSVFGGGAGVETHGYSALVRGNTTVTVEGNAKVGHSVYGGGEIASVGKYGLDSENMPSILQGGGYCYVTVQGHATITDDVFGAGEGVKSHFDNTNEDLSKRSRRMTLKSDWTSRVGADRFDWNYLTTLESYSKYLETLALVTHPEVAIDGSAAVGGSVFGGGDLGLTKGSVVVNIKGGTITKDVYGGGKLANTNTTSTVETNGVQQTVHPTTKVNLLGGLIKGDAYGGGLGQKTGVNGATSDIEAIVYGDVNVNLNGLEVSDYVASAHSSLVTGLDKDDNNAFTSYRTNNGCVVAGKVFGCNNINGTPMGHAKVHVFKTMPRSGKTYDVDAVFGGGNAADYTPDDTKQSTEVIIEGCGLTSIEQVYGGGNAAATPGSSVLVKGTKIINELFGGGNGELGANYAANVGYHFDASTGTRSNYTLGAGQALVQLMAGTINYVYGGSNSNGDIRGGASITTPSNDHSAGCCDELVTKQISGGGKNADMDSGADIVIDCRNSSAWVEEIYAGSENADVGGNVRLTITSGKFGRVFGGNKTGGKLNGSITVNIEESPTCGIPVVIGELYAGGNKAPYSIYGYSDAGEMLTSGTPKHSNPVLNVRAFTSIGNIYGGGFGENAVMYGSPTVNINSVEVDHTDKSNAEFQGNKYNGETHTIIDDPDDSSKNYDVYLYPHDDGKMGVIGNVFGGGNAAKVYGDTNVNIGTKSIDVFHTPVNATEEERTHNVVGADIRGNVYGGGNNAAVTGNTNVTIGQERTTTP